MMTAADTGGQRSQPSARRRGDLSASTYDQLRDAIVTLRLAPGAALIESELCERLHVSRTPMRATLQRLQQQGFAVYRPSRSSRGGCKGVRRLFRGTLAEAYRLAMKQIGTRGA